jgi:hypothetical protein
MKIKRIYVGFESYGDGVMQMGLLAVIKLYNRGEGNLENREKIDYFSRS